MVDNGLSTIRSVFLTTNVYTETGGIDRVLVINLKEEDPPIDCPNCGSSDRHSMDYSAGKIQTRGNPFSYGYYEARMKLPKSYGFWIAFWIYGAGGAPNPHYNEVDIQEPDKCLMEYANTLSTNLHVDNYQNVLPDFEPINIESYEKIGCYGDHLFYPIPELYFDYHTYGLEIQPDRMIWYFDNQPVRTVTDIDLIPAYNMNVIFSCSVADTPVTFKYPYYRIDWFRFFEIKTDASNANITNQTQFNSFNYSVRPYITIGNGSNSIALNSTDKITFRADYSITVNGIFEVPLGAELNLITAPFNP
jgi:beta-glucanase (GH16 family)